MHCLLHCYKKIQSLFVTDVGFEDVVAVTVKFKTHEFVFVRIIHDDDQAVVALIVDSGIRIQKDFAEKFDCAGITEIDFFAQRQSCFVFFFAVNRPIPGF